MAWLRVLLLLGSCSLAYTSDYAAPRYNISLDLPPEERWKPVIEQYNFTELHQYMNNLLSVIKNHWSKHMYYIMADIYLDFIAHEPYAGEIRGIAKSLGLKTSEVTLINLFYETVMACTSIIAETEEGYIYHGRNMDLYIHTDLRKLRKLVIDVDFIRNGQIVYTGTTFPGLVGLYTGQSPHKFTISANAREDNHYLWKNALSLLLQRYPVSWLIRNTLNNAPDFDSAVEQLSDTEITAEIYLTVAGTKPGEGVAITRDRDGLADTLNLNASDGRWFLIQTNYDRGIPHPAHDNRMHFATQAMNSTGQENINKDSLYKVLSTFGVIKWATIHTTMMSAASPEDYLSFIRIADETLKTTRISGVYIVVKIAGVQYIFF
ncbi:PREDICTED: N-acylethanolamine-hydrolyzing acid amidase-like [Nanorana parkeri]|uniref:N-acylethanolamine-hydrolyzing acid amidase-like n=1 Tax=Nanorana parkeri TaxID=125878 RepID=UPI000854F3D1|nr:PREDICTED: N-acylethanolamine-hydrolyzing acid amidase-like [Nanorana parkeri]